MPKNTEVPNVLSENERLEILSLSVKTCLENNKVTGKHSGLLHLNEQITTIKEAYMKLKKGG